VSGGIACLLATAGGRGDAGARTRR
jgi:hypothetical protein